MIVIKEIKEIKEIKVIKGIKVIKEIKEDSDCESTKRVVIMAKHLCGVATDLALRSLESFKIQNTNKNGKFYFSSL